METQKEKKVTLIIAGHHLEKDFSADRSDYEDGLFAVADSNITQGNRILVSGFKKVVEVPIKVKTPNFTPDGYFQGYGGTRYESACFVAFAGSTLVAQHIMNSIRNHLTELFPTHNGKSYELAMVCEERKWLSNTHYPNDMFVGPDYLGLLTGELISEVTGHAIQAVLDRAKAHGSMKEIFSAYQAEFILGVQCPSSRKYELYNFQILPDGNDGAKVEKSTVEAGRVAVIGRKEPFAADAQIAYTSAIESAKCTSEAMHQFISDAIDSQNQIGRFDIGKPCILYRLRGKSLKLASRIG